MAKVQKYLPKIGEVSKDINEYVWKYAITNLGRVVRYYQWSKPLEEGVLARQFVDSYGSNSVRTLLSDFNGNRRKYTIQSLVASAFISNPMWHRFVGHIDGDITNNAATNLERVPREEHIHKSFTTFMYDWITGKYIWDTKANLSEESRRLWFDPAAIGNAIKQKVRTWGFYWSKEKVPNIITERNRCTAMEKTYSLQNIENAIEIINKTIDGELRDLTQKLLAKGVLSLLYKQLKND